MNKINSLEELRQIQLKAAKDISLRTIGEMPEHIIINISMGDSGIASGSKAVMNALLDAVDATGDAPISVIATDSFGFPFAEPMVSVHMPDKELVRYARVNADFAKEIVEKHVMQGIVLDGALTGNEVPKQ